MYKKMLVLLDGSELAEVVFTYARELSARLKIKPELLHVCAQADQMPMCRAYIENMAEKLRKSIESNKTGTRTGEKEIVVKGTAVVGYPADEILKYADECKADIIMLSTHGSSGIRRWGLGSVADKVIHETKVPIWLVPSQLREEIIFDKMPRRSILIPLDGSKLAEAVIPYVEDLIKQRGKEIEIILVNVARKSPVPAAISIGEKRFAGEDFARMKTIGEDYMHDIAEKLRQKGHKVQIEQLIGDPAEEIGRFAAKSQPLVIAMSTHDRTGFDQIIFSSVAEKTLRRIQKTPLFLIRPQENSK
jgi:nucleotide-binding universal stress UspA family protein